jgi:hypothetical protein
MKKAPDLTVQRKLQQLRASEPDKSVEVVIVSDDSQEPTPRRWGKVSQVGNHYLNHPEEGVANFASL